MGKTARFLWGEIPEVDAGRAARLQEIEAPELSHSLISFNLARVLLSSSSLCFVFAAFADSSELVEYSERFPN